MKKSDIKIRHYHKFEIESIKGKKADETMLIGCGLLKIKDLHYWITSGNLLGIYRDKKLIEHDTDIDVGVMLDWGLDSNYDLAIDLVKSFSKIGFYCVRSMVADGEIMQLAFMDQKRQVLFDIFFFYRGIKDGFVVNYNEHGTIEKPIQFVAELDEIEFKGEKYPCPHDLEKFLEWRFGDWKTPAKKKIPWEQEGKRLKKW